MAALRQGDCFQEPGGTAYGYVEIVPCSQPHDLEAFAAFDVTATAYPGPVSLYMEAEASCLPEFEEFVGLSEADSELAAHYIYPTQWSWNNGDHEVVCALYDPRRRPLTLATMRGSGR